jgi:AraC family transcriptional regulator
MIDAFRQGLNDTGYVVGQNVAFEHRAAGSEYDRFRAMADDLVRRQVAVIFATGGTAAALAAKTATSTIPIYNLPPVPGGCIRDSWGVQDELVNQIGLSVLSEMMCPTAAGRMLVETSSLLLAARLAHSHFETGLIRSPIPSGHRLDDRRLRRVLAYVEEHLADDIAVADLANVACLSIFHFTRAFAATMGVPPHRYVRRRRLESAKTMIATGSSLSEIAFNCQFSSQSSFTRAFRRATGMTPAEYRRTLQ